MGEAKRRKLVGETDEQKEIRQLKWSNEKNFGNHFRNAERHIKGRFDPETKEIKEY